MDQYSANPLHSTWSKPESFAKLIRSALAKHEEGDEIENSDNDSDSNQIGSVDDDIIKRSSRSHRDQNLSYENDFEDDDN